MADRRYSASPKGRARDRRHRLSRMERIPDRVRELARKRARTQREMHPATTLINNTYYKAKRRLAEHGIQV